MSEQTSHHPFDQFIEAAEAEVFVRGELDRLMKCVGDTLYDHYLDSLNVGFIVNQTSSTLINVLEIEYTRRDTGETEPWAEDSEPPPCSIDTWGRGAIPVRRKYRVGHATVSATPLPRDGSSRSLLSSITRASQAFKSKVHQRPGTGPPVNEERSHTPVLLPFHKEQATAEEDRLRQQKEVESLHRAAEAERVRKEVEAESERIKELAKRAHELRSKPFTYDYEGRIMMLRPIRDDSASVTEFILKTEDPPKTANKKSIERVGSGTELPVLRHKRPPVKQVEFIKNPQTVQPPLFDNMQLAAGVRMGEGNRVKASPLRMRRTTISRAQYRKVAEEPEQLLTESSVSSSVKYHHQDDKGSKVAKESSLKQGVVSPYPELLSAIPDNEDASMQASYQPRPSPPKSKSAMSIAPITQFGGGMEEAEGLSEVDQFNFQILKSKNWGMNPPIKEPNVPSLPKFSSLKTFHETYGLRSKLPRERPFIISQTSRRHLPPPPLGKTIGHGLLSGQVEMQGLLTERSARSKANK
jgi:hypothetical protein